MDGQIIAALLVLCTLGLIEVVSYLRRARDDSAGRNISRHP